MRAGEREKVLAAGMDEYLTKPLRPAALRQALEAFARTPGARSSPRPPPSVAALPEQGPEREVLDPKIERSADLNELFLELIPGQIDALGQAITRGEAPEVSAHAHKLKGGTLAIGARQMASVAAALEESAQSGRLSQAPTRLVELRESFERVSEHLREEFASSADDPAKSDREAG